MTLKSDLKVKVVLDVDLAGLCLDAEQVPVLLGGMLRELVDDACVVADVAVPRLETDDHRAHGYVFTRPHLDSTRSTSLLLLHCNSAR